MLFDLSSFFFFKQKTAYEMRISDWSSDVCSSDLDFVGKIRDTGCRVFIVHARNAVLKGLSPKDNREKPPLRYDAAARLKADFPDCIFVLNGGIAEAQRAVGLMDEFDGVMLGDRKSVV